MIAKAALALSVVAVAISVASFATRGTKHSNTCGLPQGYTLVTCTGNDAPLSKFGTCAPVTRNNGITFWKCRKQ